MCCAPDYVRKRETIMRYPLLETGIAFQETKLIDALLR